MTPTTTTLNVVAIRAALPPDCPSSHQKNLDEPLSTFLSESTPVVSQGVAVAGSDVPTHGGAVVCPRGERQLWTERK